MGCTTGFARTIQGTSLKKSCYIYFLASDSDGLTEGNQNKWFS